jgi:hypothetical protein
MSSNQRKEILKWFWLSFCDIEAPKGQQFLGVVILQADCAMNAVTLSHTNHINPGGEVQIVELYDEFATNIPEVMRYRLLTRHEVETIGKLKDPKVLIGEIIA